MIDLNFTGVKTFYLLLQQFAIKNNVNLKDFNKIKNEIIKKIPEELLSKENGLYLYNKQKYCIDLIILTAYIYEIYNQTKDKDFLEKWNELFLIANNYNIPDVFLINFIYNKTINKPLFTNKKIVSLFTFLISQLHNKYNNNIIKTLTIDYLITLTKTYKNLNDNQKKILIKINYILKNFF